MIVPPMTSPQLRAATSNDLLCYVKAGPGSGKTFTAAEAFGYLRFVRHRSDQRGICGTTFARSARRELANRIRCRWGPNATRWPNAICTFDEVHRRLVRYIVGNGLLEWPGGKVPNEPEDSWATHPDASSKPGTKTRYRTGLDEEGRFCIVSTSDRNRAPAPVFIAPDRLKSALSAGRCTHSDIRNILHDIIDRPAMYPILESAIKDCLAGSFCHLIVDEAFDMNLLDIAVVEKAIQAGIAVTIIGDPWQSLYEFRGSAPKQVTQLIERHPFRHIDMPGEHRYESAEMKDLANALFNNRPFQVKKAHSGDKFDVVLAHDWETLWVERRILTLPAGKWNKIDRRPISSCFVLLLNDFVQDTFQIEASGVGEARRAFPHVDLADRLVLARQALVDRDKSEADVWGALRHMFQPDGQNWAEPGVVAQRCMTRLVEAARLPGRPVLGLSVHQAKGLEWKRVLFLDPMLAIDEPLYNVLEIDEVSHRNVYVALTRARSLVRVLHVGINPYGSSHSAIKYGRVKRADTPM